MSRSRHFCCCIPVRAAVFFFSLLSLLSSGIVAAAFWYLLFELQSGKQVGDVNLSTLPGNFKTVVIVGGVIFTIIALISLFGFVGAITRNRKFVKLYSYFTWITFILSLAASGFYLYAIFAGKNFYKGCTFTDEHGVVRDCVVNMSTGQKIGSTVFTVIQVLINLYIAIVIRRYVDQLEDEHDYKSEYKLAAHSKHNSSTYTPTYYPTTAQDPAVAQGLLNSGHKYPYTDSAHAFGSHA